MSRLISRVDVTARKRPQNWKRRLAMLASVGGILGVALLVRTGEGDRPAEAAPRVSPPMQEEAPAKAEPPQHDVMAIVNGQDISREKLTEACVTRHGKKVLESLVNKRLIENHCKKRGITVTSEEIAAEVDRMASRFQLGREQWLAMLEKERGVTAQEYARDIVWPTLALRKLAAADLTVTKEEQQLAYEREYGEKINARLIAVRDASLARQIHSQVTADPELFAQLAIEKSVDINSASIGGLIQPIARHVGDKAIEKEAFALRPGQISSIIKVADQFVILKCERRIPPRQATQEEFEKRVVERIRDEKLREVAGVLFSQLQQAATVQNVYNDPQLREKMPGVVATVNGDRVTMKQLGAECLARHGEEVLSGVISRTMLEQHLNREGVKVTEADLRSETRHAAELAGVVDEAGEADVAKWVEMATAQQGVTQDQYFRDSVWPSAALKKLSEKDIKVEKEDISKGYEANYGERVRCRAIVMGNMRRAQEVWDKARQNQSLDYFGDLAAEYSIEPTSKALRGEVPPIQRHGGQPQMEEVAFKLAPGQLSGIVQLGDKFVILRCEGRTDRVEVDQEKVREILYRDIYEKKLRIAMSEKFEQIRETSRIDNYLAGTSVAPAEKGQQATGQAKLHRDSAVEQTSTRF
ncbi:peptidylprolyl isomerase [Adhaeretor mobilis]|uniref:peptidylprolyl isomerase n=1 Tax=Adhaeretor mobilis TaxID=1930276 RepID=A0A517MSH9_9BACT|nr:peptidylprolyl isomerase [Adhaeretor mobilis]QDS97840.1 Foldase protein PrsA precursor [Adhaeretor mobilis]